MTGGRSESGAVSVVFVHGALSNGAVWQDTVQALDARFRAATPDLPGHGSAPRGRGMALAVLARAMAGYCEELGIRRPILVGWSLGGAVALQMCADGFDARGLVLVGAAPQAVASDDFPHGMAPEAARLRDRGLAANPAGTFRQLARQTAPEDPEVAARLAEMAAALPLESVQALFRASWTDSLVGRLSGIHQPTEILHGTEDRIFPPACAEFLARALPDAGPVRWIEGAGHAPHLTWPAEFRAALHAALDRLEGG